MKPEYPETYGARFGCGFVVGVVFALFLVLSRYLPVEGPSFLVAVIGIACICGLAAMRFGFAFFKWISRLF